MVNEKTVSFLQRMSDISGAKDELALSYIHGDGNIILHFALPYREK